MKRVDIRRAVNTFHNLPDLEHDGASRNERHDCRENWHFAEPGDLCYSMCLRVLSVNPIALNGSFQWLLHEGNSSAQHACWSMEKEPVVGENSSLLNWEGIGSTCLNPLTEVNQ